MRTRIRVLSGSEILARASRNNSIGGIVVERFHEMKGSNTGFYIIVSSHVKMDQAIKAKNKLDKKLEQKG